MKISTRFMELFSGFFGVLLLLTPLTVLAQTKVVVIPLEAEHTGPLAPVPKTGQTLSMGERDDGALQKGVQWPSPRFIDNGNGTVADKLTGLIWLRNANRFGPKSWPEALSDCNGLSAGSSGLTDGSKVGDWRLPNIRELLSLVDYGKTGPCLPEGHPFDGVNSNAYWSSTYRDYDSWVVSFSSPSVFYVIYISDARYYVWPVRGGQ
jgi:hypothetical protein